MRNRKILFLILILLSVLFAFFNFEVTPAHAKPYIYTFYQSSQNITVNGLTEYWLTNQTHVETMATELLANTTVGNITLTMRVGLLHDDSSITWISDYVANETY